MQRYTKTVSRWFRSLLIVSLFTATGAQAAEKIDLIIDTDPGADDVVALLFALASPEELNIRALTTVAGNVRLDKTSRNARLAREWAGREEVPVYRSMPRTSTARKASPESPCTNPRRRWPRAMR